MILNNSSLLHRMVLSVLAGFVYTSISSASSRQDQPPNIMIIMADDVKKQSPASLPQPVFQLIFNLVSIVWEKREAGDCFVASLAEMRLAMTSIVGAAWPRPLLSRPMLTNG